SFEEGMKLSSLCQKKLSAAQRKVEVLIKGEDGKLKAEPF
ncbi:exodeoxyribonuclease VII small subunit, partial [bacterium]|nr:exodeoxyribonuclease VII small subunit [bacterium]